MTSPIDFTPPSLRFPIEEYIPPGPPRLEQPRASQRKKERSEMCHHVEELGGCIYGDRCSFAHRVEEIKELPKPPNYRRNLCRNFFRYGVCYYGTKCRFSHSVSYAHALGYVYDPSLSAYVRDKQLHLNDFQKQEDARIVACWANRKNDLLTPQNASDTT